MTQDNPIIVMSGQFCTLMMFCQKDEKEKGPLFLLLRPELCLRDRKFAVRFTSEDVKLTNLLIEDSRPRRIFVQIL